MTPTETGLWALAVHGGAGSAAELRAEDEPSIRAALNEVLEAGARLLAAGGTSLDVVEDAVRRLEDSPLFNAGRGAVFNEVGAHELEASIMAGQTLGAGAVAGVASVRNPILLARQIMEHSPHVYLQGDGALAFARERGLELAAPDYFWTEARWTALEQARARASADGGRASPSGGEPGSEGGRPGPVGGEYGSGGAEPGTVGAVALDRHGNVAAATSTGGMTNKRRGRVGDSSVIGAGTYASNAGGAVSCTGHGELFIRTAAAHEVCALIEHAGKAAQAAVDIVIRERLAPLGGRGGIIVVDRNGHFGLALNTEVMPRGFVRHDAAPVVAISADAG